MLCWCRISGLEILGRLNVHGYRILWDGVHDYFLPAHHRDRRGLGF